MKKIIVAFLLMNLMLLWAGCEKESNIKSQMRDSRDGEIYALVTIGNQRWMAENLRYSGLDSSLGHGASYQGDYGRLYKWEAAKIACPNGWHLPSDEEWSILEVALGLDYALINRPSRGFHGRSMKSKTGWSNDKNGTNSSNFNVFPDGYGYHGGGGPFTTIDHFEYIGSAYFWTSTEDPIYPSSMALYRRLIGYLSYDGNEVRRGSWSTSEYLYSCRCVED